MIASALSVFQRLPGPFNNWSRDDRPQWGFPGHFIYGAKAWERWIADLKAFDSFSTKDKQQLFFANWWNFNCMKNARNSASKYLSKNV